MIPESRRAGGRGAVVEALARSNTALLFLHINADGDSVGSTLALFHALSRRGTKCWATFGDRFPEPYRFLPGAEKLVFWRDIDPDRRFDLAVLPDCSGTDRVGAAEVLLSQAEKIVNIDHHRTNTGFGDVWWVDPSRSCVGEMVLEIIDDLEVPMDEQIATCLYTAIMTDTGSFAFENTTPLTHTYAARLLDSGVKPHLISQQLYGNMRPQAIRLLADVLNTLTITAQGKVAWMVVSRAARQEHDAGPHDADGFIAYPRSVSGVEIAILFYEEDDGSVRIGLRSKRWADVSQIAVKFGGGGHVRAAGCRHPGPLSDAVKDVVRHVENYVTAFPSPGGQNS